MLYLYNGKVYVRPVTNKIVEVDIKKELNGNYDVQPTKNVIVRDDLDKVLTSIALEKAYDVLHKNSKRD